MKRLHIHVGVENIEQAVPFTVPCSVLSQSKPKRIMRNGCSMTRT
jgi:hypothetical protein